MKLAIIGTRGIPNNYGGFEQFAQYLSLGLVQKGHEVTVYNSHNHFYKDKMWQGVHINHQFDPEYRIGTAGQFIYDFNCIVNSRKHHFDIILQLGYTSSSIWNSLFSKTTKLVTNMDGLEWKRTKYGKSTQKFLIYAEKLAVKYSNHLVSDSIGIQNYITQKYNLVSEYIPYGATLFNQPEPHYLEKYSLKPYQYDLLIARLEPENSLDIILEGFSKSELKRPFVVVGNHDTKYGRYLKEKYKGIKGLVFLGSIYEMEIVNNLRYFSNLYFHGHTVGGTNPSLLEAMASQALIAANKNDFNEFILGTDAFYFNESTEVSKLLNDVCKIEKEQTKIQANLSKISELYSWQKIITSYENFFIKILSSTSH